MLLVKRIQGLKWAVLLPVLFLLSFAEPGLTKKTEIPEFVDRIVAKVNDEIILLSELNEALKSYTGKVNNYSASDEKRQELIFKLREDVLNQLVEKKLSEQQIKELGIRIEDGEIDNTIERIKESNFFTDETLRKMLAEKGMTLDQYRGKIKEQILRAKLIDYEVKSNIIVTKEDIEAYYNDHHKEYSGTSQYHLRNIIMKTPGFSEGKQQVLEKMKVILLRLKQGEAFADLAMTYSESPIAANGGDIGLFKPDDLVKNIRDSVEKINPGEVTDIIDTDLGYQIFYLEEIVTTEGITLEKATPAIEESLYKQELENKFKAWISDLKEEAHIQLIK